jgi:hypothetical protein
VPSGHGLGPSAIRDNAVPGRLAGFMVLSRLACMLIRVYAPQVAAAQPAAITWSKLAGTRARIETVRRVGDRIVAS